MTIAHLVLKRMGKYRYRAVLQQKGNAVMRRYFLPGDKERAVIADQFAECLVDRRNKALFQHVLRKMSAGDDSVRKVQPETVVVNGITSFAQKPAHLLVPVDPCVREFPEFADEFGVFPIDEQSDDMDVPAPVLGRELDAGYDFGNGGRVTWR